MMTILSIIDELVSDNSRLAKEAILKREIKNDLLREVFKAAYDPYINYWVLKIPEYECGHVSPTITLNQALNEVKKLSSREVTGNAAINTLGWILSNCQKDDAVIIERVIGRDLRCGVGIPTINKIWPGLIKEFEVMLAHKDTSGIKYPAYCQTKMDGMRVHMYFDGSDVQAFTRNGKQVTLHGVFQKTARAMMYEGEVWDGELLCYHNGKALDRKTSNGIGNKGVKGTISEKEAEMLRFVVWDIVDFTSTVPYIGRFRDLESRYQKAFGNQLDTKFYLVASQVVQSEDEAADLYSKAIAVGEEGVILKNMDSVWQGKRTKDMGKWKAEEEADLRVVGWEEGTGKNKGKLGALACETEDGKCQVNVGTGWSDEDRATLTEENTVGRILTVRYNMKITDKSTGLWSLFLPRVVEFRDDKNVANSLGELK